ncbi:hypothetical protein C6H64_13225 [Photorhabdus luminescens]|uniref:Uncharacterized protein n=1 Tax=Photorhabdus aegyptia TaxID=2805098 RepID=A0A022PH70_9GAMM|nr:hypothetical protein [Photorhabdus aegyptia]EYU15011.1 hypothetical protein BA1DRAFT_02479 [Photorhabdus aegyptia]PQQ29029.1 hypothetical protein C6H64_13225 [Photorhabdus luminescens]PQQ33271.1 hypothetical protein C6H69_11800 [Photorhabdus luminescens]
MHYSILVAEGVKGSDCADYDVMEFLSLKDLQKYRASHSEKMKYKYSYLLSSGTRQNSHYIGIVNANHFKKFVKLVKESGINI